MRRLLAIDDEPHVLRAVQRVLKDWDVTPASSAAEALALLATRTFDAILCDVRMPEVNGLQLLEQLRVRYPAAAARFVLMSATMDHADANTAADRPFLAKPFSAAALREILSQIAALP